MTEERLRPTLFHAGGIVLGLWCPTCRDLIVDPVRFHEHDHRRDEP